MSWIKQLYKDQILDLSEHQGKPTYHLKTPCEVIISEEVISQLEEMYLPNEEIGGVLVTKPVKNGKTTVLKIDKIIQIDNVHPDNETTYQMDSDQWKNVRKLATEQGFLPIQFHTHPTKHKNPAFEVMNYLVQSNTSQQDQKVSNNVLVYTSGADRIKERFILPEALVLGSVSAGRLFIGFYNGLIAPIEFSSNKDERFKQELDKFFDKISAWSEKDENKILLIGGGVVLLTLLIGAPKTMIPVLMVLIAMIPIFFINDQHGEPEYFAQISGGSVKIKFPEI